MKAEDRQDLWPNVATVRAEARRLWEDHVRETVSVQERIGESVPWWLVIIAFVFFALSVPHTMTVFAKITPNVGYVAPFGIEFGLLYAAFRRKQKGLNAYLLILEALLFFTAVVVNGAGSFEAVVASTENVAGLSIADLWEKFPELPATSQIALLLAPVAAFIIPIGTAVAGEGLAALFLERREAGDLLEARWQKEGPMIEFEALRDAAIDRGQTPAKAEAWAKRIAFYAHADRAGQGRTVSAHVRSGHNADRRPDASGQATGQGYRKKMDARRRVWAALEATPDMGDLSVRELAGRVGVGKTTAADVLGQWKASRNGHEEKR